METEETINDQAEGNQEAEVSETQAEAKKDVLAGYETTGRVQDFRFGLNVEPETGHVSLRLVNLGEGAQPADLTFASVNAMKSFGEELAVLAGNLIAQENADH